MHGQVHGQVKCAAAGRRASHARDYNERSIQTLRTEVAASAQWTIGRQRAATILIRGLSQLFRLFSVRLRVSCKWVGSSGTLKRGCYPADSDMNLMEY